MAERGYQICKRCIMDTSDPEIVFDDEGCCNHCRRALELLKDHWYPNEEGKRKLDGINSEIKKWGRNREYDCILGVSGGVDSSYLTYKTKEMGLRPLCVHIDAGWNSELAVRNIENMIKKLGYDLHTYVVDWEEVKDLQVAFLKAGVANQDVPQDHVFFAKLYRVAAEKRIKYVLSGANYASESILPASWGYDAMDKRHLVSIHRRFGSRKLNTFPTVSFFKRNIYYPYIRGMTVVKPLNYMPYNKFEAIKFLEKEFGWKYYGGKHYESRFTKYFQSHYLPERFGYDKRRAHLSSLIMANQITREEALQEMQKPLYNERELREDEEYIIKKLGMSREEWDAIKKAPNRTFKDYPSYDFHYQIKTRVRKLLKGS